MFSNKINHFQFFDIFVKNWIRFNQFCREDLDSNNKFGAKIGLKSDSITISFDLKAQVDLIA